MSDERIKKLPRWAQTLISDQALEVRDLRQELSRARLEAEEDSRMTLDTHSHRGIDDHPIPEGRIKINVLPKGVKPILANERDAYVEVALRGEDEPHKGLHVELRSGRGLILIPESRNIVRVYPEPVKGFKL